MIFCHTSTRISHIYTLVPSLLNLPLISLPTPLFSLFQLLFEFFESYSKFLLAICFTHGIINFYVTLSIHLPFSRLSSHLVHRSVLYVSFYTAALKINLSVPSLRFHVCVCVCVCVYVSIQYLYFSF